jgi:hypothetical protein
MMDIEPKYKQSKKKVEIALNVRNPSYPVTENEMKQWIGDEVNRPSYGSVLAFYEKMGDRIPTAIDNVPVWRYACLKGNPEFYTADLCQMCCALSEIWDMEEGFYLLAKVVQQGFDKKTEKREAIESLVKEDEVSAEFWADFRGCLTGEVEF